MYISRITGAQVAAASPSSLSPAKVAERAPLVVAMRSINANNIFGLNNELTFVVDGATQRMAFRVIDRATHEVILQLPPENILRLAADLQNGSNKAKPDQYTPEST
jgi:hypothetical protein